MINLKYLPADINIDFEISTFKVFRMDGNGNGAWTGHLHGGGHPRAVQDVEPLLLGDVAVVVLVRLQEILPQLKVDHCNLQLTSYN